MGWFHAPRRRRRRYKVETLEDLIEHLIENPDQIYILPSLKAAMVYYPPNETIIVIYGDFSGDHEQCNRELQLGLRKLVAQDTAWLN